MPIEVRQLIIKSTVGGAPDAERVVDPTGPSLEALKEEILDECKSLIEEKLQQLRER